MGKLVRILVKLGGRDDFVNEAKLFRFFRCNRLSRHDQLKGSSGTDHSCQEVATSRIGYQAHSDEGLFEARLLLSHSDIAGKGQDCPASRGDTIQTANYRYID